MKPEWCCQCRAVILTIKQMQTTKLCDKCGKHHADTFPERIKVLGEIKLKEDDV